MPGSDASFATGTKTGATPQETTTGVVGGGEKADQAATERYLISRSVKIIMDLSEVVMAISQHTGQAVKGQSKFLEDAAVYVQACEAYMNRADKAPIPAEPTPKTTEEQGSFCKSCGSSWALHSGKDGEVCPS